MSVKRKILSQVLLFSLLLLPSVLAGCGEDSPVVTDGSDYGLHLNEVLASNETVLADPDFDQYSDWFELFNSNAEDVDLGGYFLSDDPADPDQWRIPTGTVIPAGGWLLFWADSRDTTVIAMHTSFKLGAAEGETLSLFTSDGKVVDLVTFGPQSTGISWGRNPDGGDQFSFFTSPTPGTANGVVVNPPPEFIQVGMIPAFPAPTDTVSVIAVIIDDGAWLDASLHYETGGELLTLAMTATSGDSFVVVIPAQNDSAVVSYYLEAVDDGGEITLFPPGAPSAVDSYLVQSEYLPPVVVINEFLAKNDTGLEDEAGEKEDWVELFNTSAELVPLNGWTLADNSDTWNFPDTSITAGGYLLIWCDSDGLDGPLHTNFKLGSTDGDEIHLSDVGGEPVDSIIFTSQAPDTSMGRLPDGGPDWITMPVPTPGRGNE
jgi:hypothetical protein